jgi:competence protein ComEC
VQFQSKLAAVPKYNPPWSYEAHLTRIGVSGTGKAKQFEIIRVGSNTDQLESFIEKLTIKVGSSLGLDLVIASLLGKGEVLAKAQNELFKQTSTTHLIVVSGFHVGILSRLSEKLGISLLKFYPKVFLYVPAQRLGPIVGLLVATLYGWTIGFSLTVVRALIALVVLALGRTIYKKATGISALLVALILVQGIWPGSIFEPSCQLTFAALLGLIFAEECSSGLRSSFLPDATIEAELKGHDWRIKRFFFDYFLAPPVTCFVVGLTVNPITLVWFSQFVPLSPLINVILIPVFTFFVLILGGVGLFLYKLIGLTWLVKFAVFSSHKVIELIENLNLFSHSIGLGPLQLSNFGVVFGVLAHLILLIIILKISKQIRKSA